MAKVASPRSTPLYAPCSGRTKDALLGHTLADYAGAGPTSRYHASQLTSAAHDRRSAELQVFRPDGSEVWLGVVTTLVCEVSGENYWFEQLHDVTGRKQAERALQELAMFDPLTGLPNQNLLKDRVAQALNRAGQEGSGVAVVLIGIDRFRVVTDSLGHSAGEAVLAQFAKVLQEAVPDRTVARVGGDVFAILVEGAAAVAGTVEWAQRQFCSASRHRFEVEGSELYVAFSAGIAFRARVSPLRILCGTRRWP